MSTAPAPLGDALPLFEALFAALVTAGRPVLPPGRKREVIDLLTRVMTDPDLFAAYTGELRSRRAALGRQEEFKLLKAGDTDIPGEQILSDGFGGLTDEVLADLATSPEALIALDRAHFGDDDQPGAWFFEASDRAATARKPAVPASAAAPPAPRRGPRWVVPAALTALAASIVLNIYLGFAGRGGGGATKPTDEWASARVVIENTSERGPDDKPLRQVRVSGPARGYVAMLVLANDNKQYVRPTGGTFIRISPEGAGTPVLLEDADARVIVYAVTEAPAGEVVRGALGQKNSRRYRPDQADDAARDLKRVLQESGYRQFVVGVESVPSP